MRIIARQFWKKSTTTRPPCLSIVSLRLSLIFKFLNDYLGIMDVNDSECNVHYSLDSQRDFEDFCEAVIRQTVDADLPHRR